MHNGRNYPLKQVIQWTRRETAVFVLLSAIPTVLYAVAGWKWLVLPWPPLAIIGTAVAFMTGFKSNASYGRLWEARQIWGGIVNGSRSFALLVLDSVPAPEARRVLLRHVAWLTALRYQLREPRAWETVHRAHNVEYQRHYQVAEWGTSLEPALAGLLDGQEQKSVLARKNRAHGILQVQAENLRACAEASIAGELRHLELMRQVAALVEAQGKCERLKNFPYPRQFATINLYFVWLFIVLTPFCLLPEFQKFGSHFVWLTIPMSVLIAWIFHTMDKIGDSSENPFEGGPNDIPITAMSRGIEIDLREMLGDTELPAPVQAVNNILM
ncbi:MAG: multidrug transporter [Acidobacteria bacterium]|nr:multidrug transporter [Acidobacteriota bacterium]